MVKLTEITICRGRTINLGNYNSGKAEIWVKGEIEDSESFEDAYYKLNVKAKVALELEVEKIRSP